MLKYIFRILVVLIGFGASAQFPQGLPQGTPRGNSGSSQEPVTMKDLRALRRLEPKDWSIKYLKFSYDAIPTGRFLLNSNRKGQEIQAAIHFYKYFFVVEGGFQDFTRTRTDLYDYQSSGTFFRVGPEVNLIKANEQGGAFTFGVRYAQSSFGDNISFSYDNGFGPSDFALQNRNARLIWMELTTGLNLPVHGNWQMGYLIRFKALRKVTGLEQLTPFDVAGFGRYEKRTALGFSYYIGYAIPFKKMEKAPVE